MPRLLILPFTVFYIRPYEGIFFPYVDELTFEMIIALVRVDGGDSDDSYIATTTRGT